jgi:hypothetical protein
MTQDQQKYLTDQQAVAGGKMDPSQLTTDWNAYLQAATAWQTSSVGGNNPPPAILPIKEDQVSNSLSTDWGSSTPTTVSPSPTPTTVSPMPTTSLQTGSSSGSGAMSILGGPSTVASNYPGLYAGYIPGIEAASKATGVSANILAGVIATESRGFGNLSNPMQVNADQGSMNANIMEGAKELVQHADTMNQKYGKYDLGLTLRAYNSGDNGVDPNDLSALPAGTGQPYYVTQVESNIQALQSGSGSITQ